MRYLPMHLRVPGRCGTCGSAITFDGKRWVDRPRVVHACPQERPTCNAVMPGSGRGPERRLRTATERCGRRPGHTGHHRSRWAMDNELYAKTGHRLAS